MILRIARHTNKIKELAHFYTEIIGLKVTGQFEQHDGYDGIFLGKDGLGWELEFTTTAEPVNQKSDEDDLTVFYPDSQKEYDRILNQIRTYNLETRKAKNPYWHTNGILIHDPDGFGIVISPLKIKDKT